MVDPKPRGVLHRETIVVHDIADLEIADDDLRRIDHRNAIVRNVCSSSYPENRLVRSDSQRPKRLGFRTDGTKY